MRPSRLLTALPLQYPPFSLLDGRAVRYAGPSELSPLMAYPLQLFPFLPYFYGEAQQHRRQIVYLLKALYHLIFNKKSFHFIALLKNTCSDNQYYYRQTQWNNTGRTEPAY